MAKTLATLTVAALILAAVYLIMSASALTFNPLQWEVWQRFISLFAILTVTASSINNIFGNGRKIQFKAN
jgi:hypothetical protein